MSKLKVYGGMKLRGGYQVRCIVAAANQKAAADIAHETLYGFRQYWSETGSAKEIALANTHPAVLLFCDAPRGHYTEEGFEWKRYFDD